MFSEYDISKECKNPEEDKKTNENPAEEGSEKPEKVENKENKNLDFEETKNLINERNRFLSKDRDGLNLEKRYTIWTAFSESMESWIWDIPEKKIPWFQKTLPDGRKIEVRWWEDTFSLTISKDWSDWRQENLIINFSNFKNKDGWVHDGEHTETNLIPEMSVDGNLKLLDTNLVPWDQNNIVKIVETINNEIMSKEIGNVHWTEQNRQARNREQIEKEKDDYQTLLFELNELNSNPPADNEAIAKYIMNDNNFDDKLQYLSARKTFLALCILLGSNNNIQEIKEKIISVKSNTQKESNTKNIETSWDNIVEYLSNNNTDLSLIIDNEDKIINLWISELQNKRMQYISQTDMIVNPDNPQLKKIADYLHFLTN